VWRKQIKLIWSLRNSLFNNVHQQLFTTAVLAGQWLAGWLFSHRWHVVLIGEEVKARFDVRTIIYYQSGICNRHHLAAASAGLISVISGGDDIAASVADVTATRCTGTET
jgi:hypothetical protein